MSDSEFICRHGFLLRQGCDYCEPSDYDDYESQELEDTYWDDFFFDDEIVDDENEEENTDVRGLFK